MASSAYPFAALPAGQLSPDPKMQSFYNAILAAARKVDPNADISNASGIASIISGGASIPITSTHQNDYEQFGVTPDQWVQSNMLGQPLVLAPEQRAKVQAAQLSALQQSANTAVSGGPQVQQQIEALKASWKTPAGQGLDPNTGIAIGVKPAETRVTYPDTGSMANTPFAGYSVTPPPAVKRLLDAPPVVRPIARQEGRAFANALAPQASQPSQPVNQDYQQNLNRYRQNRWGRGGS